MPASTQRLQALAQGNEEKLAELRDVEPYDLRRFAVTSILEHVRGQLKVAQEYTGHRTVQSLLRYAYAPQGAAEELAERIGWTREPLRIADEVSDDDQT